MKNFFVGILLSSGVLFMGDIVLTLFNETIPKLIGLSLGLGVIGSIGLIIVLIRERLQDKKEEEESDVFNKY